MVRLPDFMKSSNGGNEMLINNLAESVRKARQQIDDNAKYYNLEWKKDQIKELKKIAHEAYLRAIDEFENINNEYDSKISEIEKSSYQGYSTSLDYIENVKYAKTRLLADIKINPNGKDKIINNALSSKVGSQAILELIQNKEFDNSYWTDETFKKAYINSKSQAELDFEINKESQIKTIKKEQFENCNYGSYLAANKILSGDVKKGMPTLERQFDDEIAGMEGNGSNGNE